MCVATADYIAICTTSSRGSNSKARACLVIYRSAVSSHTVPGSESVYNTEGSNTVTPSRQQLPGSLAPQAPQTSMQPFPSPPISATGSDATAAVSATGATAPRNHERQLECAQKVIRALCKLAMLTSNMPGDPSVIHGRALAMELLAGVLLNHGKHFKSFPSLMAVVKSELGNCLLANSKSSAAALQRLTCHIFVLVLKTFREELKSKVSFVQ
jgi:hypothetical protein